MGPPPTGVRRANRQVRTMVCVQVPKRRPARAPTEPGDGAVSMTGRAVGFWLEFGLFRTAPEGKVSCSAESY